MNRCLSFVIVGRAALVCALAAGCSSGSADSGAADSGGAPGDASMGAAAAEAGDGGSEGAVCAKMGDLASYDAGCQWGCITTACATQASACAGDCPCNNAVLQALACTAQGGSAFSCFGAALVDTPATDLLMCSQSANSQCASACGSGGDASSD